ncbi:sialate O-acetylesterase [Zobellia uliginosa]|uniref:sialate O-acetylesterase n=1 Tax=Zobellia uliginosa TaxID=143224 RepID=UPI0026E14FDA|nr:sialate O-acetylesterase [Zobellia uliginosa]MDO6518456.1 sialate O-acetylesterase [Zobellia uliginosa]
MKPKFLIVAFLMALACQPLWAKIELPNIFSDDMVLQRNEKVSLWGWANTGEEITVHTSWDNQEYHVKTNIEARWKLEIDTPEAGGPYTISLKGDENEIVLKNVLIGEVWLCSGQSNMEWSATTNAGIDHAEEEIKKADYPNIRLFTVARRTSNYPQDDLPGTWEVCTPETMKTFSAVAYFFARRLQGELNVPIGLIDNAWGGSPAEVWAPSSVFDKNEDLKASAENLEETPWSPVYPSQLYNGMVHAITPFKIAGTIWYQGESNRGRWDVYGKLFSEMVGSWREAWGYDFPFYYVQIAPYNYKEAEQGVRIRDVQRRVLETLPNSGMVVVSDIATIDNIHPTNKQDVGLRLANLALKETYQKYEGEVYGPLFKEVHPLGKKIEVVFDHAKGLMAKGKKVTHFEVAGADGVYHPAKAVIKQDKVILSSKMVKEPLNVRFGWSNIAEPNLFNGAGLPASAFISE